MLILQTYIHKFAGVKKIILLIALLSAFCCGQHPRANAEAEAGEDTKTKMEAKSICEVHRMEIVSDDSLGLNIYYPDFNRIDLVCGKMPSSEDSTVIFCCEAAFTGQILEEFSHGNIAGDHVSGGEYFKGYTCRVNTGCFTYCDGKWGFYTSDPTGQTG